MSSTSPDPAPDISPFEAFRAARGVPEDGWWAMEALAALDALDDATQDDINEALDDARDLVATRGRSPEDLFGTPTEFAEETARYWHRPVNGVDMDSTPLGVLLVISLSGTIWPSFCMSVFLLFKGEGTVTYTMGLIAWPFVGSVFVTCAIETWRCVLRRRPVWVGVGAVVVVALAGILAVVALFVLSAPYPLWTGSRWWTVAIGGAYLLAFLVAAKIGLDLLFRDVPTGDEVDDDDDPDQEVVDVSDGGHSVDIDDEEWLLGLAYLLRTEHLARESRVRAALDEARSQAAVTGRTLAEEFGSPYSYESRFDNGKPLWLRLWAWGIGAQGAIALVILSAGLYVDGWPPTPEWWWWAVCSALFCLAQAVARRLYWYWETHAGW